MFKSYIFYKPKQFIFDSNSEIIYTEQEITWIFTAIGLLN